MMIDVTFYLYYMQKLVFNVMIKNMKNQIYSGPVVKGLKRYIENVFYLIEVVSR